MSYIILTKNNRTFVFYRDKISKQEIKEFKKEFKILTIFN